MSHLGGASFGIGSSTHEQIVDLLVVDLKHRDLHEEADPEPGVILGGGAAVTPFSSSLEDVPERAVHDPGLLGGAEHGVALPGSRGAVHHDGALGAHPHALDPRAHEAAVEALEALLLGDGDAVEGEVAAPHRVAAHAHRRPGARDLQRRRAAAGGEVPDAADHLDRVLRGGREVEAVLRGGRPEGCRRAPLRRRRTRRRSGWRHGVGFREGVGWGWSEERSLGFAEIRGEEWGETGQGGVM
jgi:hypothetical protein